MSAKLRIELERRIAWRCVRDILAAGFSITVNDGEEDVLSESTDGVAVLAAMFSTDEDVLFVQTQPLPVKDQPGVKKRFHVGWVKFIYGNEGYDVISDYTTNLESYLKSANALADR